MSRCRICKSTYKKLSMSHVACSPDCAIKWAEKQREKRQVKAAQESRKIDRERKQKLKTRSDHLKEVEVECNALVRTRDLKAGYGCISCGSMTSYPRWQAGHLLSVGAHPHLRFNLDNIHLQCVHCNMHRGGAALAYRAALIQRIGLERVEALESDQSSPKWTIEQLQQMKLEFRRLKKEIENGKNE